MIAELGGYEVDWTYSDENRIGDHIWYISDLRKLKAHYPDWSITRSLRDIILELIEAEETRHEGAA
jgi:CDP-paratose 2-epimerase